MNRETITVGEIDGAFVLEFSVDNAAFRDDDTCLEIASTLMKIAAQISQISDAEALLWPHRIMDINGNTVGEFRIKPTIKD